MMMSYHAPLEHMQFLLRDVFALPVAWAQSPATEQVTAELAQSILEEGAHITAGLLAPLNRSGDEEGVHWHAEGVTTPAGFAAAWKTFAQAGWLGLSGEPDFGGQGLPKALTVLFEEMLYSSNSSFTLYAALTSGAALTLAAHGTIQQQQLYLPKFYSGEWTGTMCLTESHAGSDLGLLRTRAEPQADGSYHITGTKIFITGGEHDLTENIVHLVLARLPDAPSGPRGISLFLVPKFLPDTNGNCGARNAVSCGATEKKMGIHASATCVMNFDGAVGTLVGEANQGLACMFTMMNSERLSIGLQGTGCAEMSLQQAERYAHDRVQGRAAVSTQAADPIIVHADVRRMLQTMRAYVQAGRAFAVYTAQYLDTATHHPDEAERARANKRVALLTPIAKAFFTDKGFDCCVLGQQVFGGHGYVRDSGQEQLVRDARIAQIYEGTNGIQAQDLVKRKVLPDAGAEATLLLEEIRSFARTMPAALDDYRAPLLLCVEQLVVFTQALIAAQHSAPDSVAAASCDYLHAFGHVLYAYMWSRMAQAAQQHPDALAAEWMITGRFYMQRLLPQAAGFFTGLAGYEWLGTTHRS